MGSARRIASICIGTFTLAQAGLLDGRRATTHWLYGRELQNRFPKVKVQVDRIFIADGPVWTSAGMTAGIDLALGLLERDVGPEAARVVAKALVVHHRRAGGQSQHSASSSLSRSNARGSTPLQITVFPLPFCAGLHQLSLPVVCVISAARDGVPAANTSRPTAKRPTLSLFMACPLHGLPLMMTVFPLPFCAGELVPSVCWITVPSSS